MLKATSKESRLHIGLFGRRNVGKSSLLNAIAHQHVSIASKIAGTTTDPVEMPMDLPPIGPVLLVDTAGVDDTGSLGASQIEKTQQVIARSNIGVLVVEAGTWTDFEEKLLKELRSHNIPVIVAFNKVDLCRPNIDLLIRFELEAQPYAKLVVITGRGLAMLRTRLGEAASQIADETKTIPCDLRETLKGPVNDERQKQHQSQQAVDEPDVDQKTAILVN